jgi:hypothetical protein
LKSLESIAQRFYAGQFASIVSELVDSGRWRNSDAHDIVFVVGSLSFLGRVQEAQAVLNFKTQQLHGLPWFEAHYYLIIALRRQRRLESNRLAARYIIDLIKQHQRSSTHHDLELYFIFASLAWYRYVDARFVLTFKWAQKAYHHAFTANFEFGRFIGYELMGHSQIALGEIRAGLKNLANSRQISKKLGPGATQDAILVIERSYRAIFGLNHASKLREDLEGSIKACSFENSFTLATLYLELARLQPLIGDGHLVEKTLNEAADIIYKLDAPFLDANLSFRLAYLAFSRGQLQKSLDLIHGARQRVMDGLDHLMALRIFGLESLILNKMGQVQSDRPQRLSQEIQLMKRTGHIVNRRIIRRLEPHINLNSGRAGEDVLGDLLDDLAADGSELSGPLREKIIATGFYGLIPRLLKIDTYGQYILFGYSNESVTIVNDGHVRHESDGWPELVRKLLLALGHHSKLNKEEIVQKVWGQSYNPLRHDPLIYALIARTRKVLEPYDHWLGATDGYYELSKKVKILQVSIKFESEMNLDEGSINAFPTEQIPDLSLRQMRIIEFAQTRQSITNKEVCEKFQVSEITASRDLAELAAKSYLRRVGKGRSTAYIVLHRT